MSNLNMNEFYSGMTMGIVQSILGHPLDTMKTLTQHNKKMVIESNPKILYRGIAYPLLSKGFTNGSRFLLADYYNKIFNGNWYLSGLATAITTSPVLSVMDYYKNVAQIGKKIDFLKMNPFRGYLPFLLRDSVGMTSYIGLYHTFKNYNLNAFISGGLAGSICWLLIYPLDTIQTRIKTGISNNFKEALFSGNLYKGTSLIIYRIFLLNAVGFYTYDKIKNWFE